MTDETELPIILRPKELKAVYAISLAIVQSSDIDVALDQIVQLTRHVFIFDNMVLYLHSNEMELEPAYARVIGRGRTAEADLAWGEVAASEAFKIRKTIIQSDKLIGWENDRLCWREFLGLSLQRGEDVLGSLVFGRFGGPPYEPEQIRLAEFIAVQISQLLEHHRLLQKVASLEAERQLQRMQDDFIATMSHELRTPLGFIKGYATTLLRQDTSWDEETRREFLEIIDQEADRLGQLIDDLLDSSRLQSGAFRFQFQTINLTQLLCEVRTRAIARNNTLDLQLSIEPEVVIQADPDRLAQVFDNLINNAVKYAPGSIVFIKVESVDGKCQIKFQDHGPGIPTEYLDHLFNRFFRVPDQPNQVRGTGLGLFLCRQIIQAHGGEIWATSEHSKGTVIWINLPCNGAPRLEQHVK
jgi:signal transduction histidine kinase